MDAKGTSGDTTEQIFLNDFVAIRYGRSHSLIIIKWKRQISFEERKELFLWARDFSIEKQVKNWLIDDEEIYHFTTEEIDWVENTWTALAASADIHKIAVYTPDHFHTLSTMTDFTLQAQKNYQHHGSTQHEVFTDYQTAMKWLTTGLKG